MTSWRELTGGVWMRTALAGLTLAMALCIWATVHALRVSEVRAAPATVSIVPGALNASSRLSVVDVATVIDVDLFSPERTAPAARYRMPGEAAPATTAPEPPKPIVLGTALAADGTSFATCQFESSRLLMVRVGDRVGDYVVKTIARGRVVFATPAGKTFEVLAPRAGS
jgi:hypothetical protein